MPKSRRVNHRPEPPTWREKLFDIIFEADTFAGKLFDILLLIAILTSVFVVMLESVESIAKNYGVFLIGAEWFFTMLFTLEYVVRIICTRRPLRYIFSFYGIVDLLAILPTYVALIGGSAGQRLAVIRALRLLRTFRILKLTNMLSEASALRHAIWAARSKVIVFLTFVVIAVVIVGSAMHLIEGRVDANNQPLNPGFDSIPASMYWAIVTMTTVGYGDVSPVTVTGKIIASCMMVLGYCMIIVPTGIVSAELSRAGPFNQSTQVCPECMAEGHDGDASHCKYCGSKL